MTVTLRREGGAANGRLQAPEGSWHACVQGLSSGILSLALGPAQAGVRLDGLPRRHRDLPRGLRV